MTTAVLPEISFASYDAEEIMGELVGGYETAAGRTLAAADPIRLFLQTITAATIQERFLLDDAAKNGVLAHARAEFLDALSDLVGVTRLAPAAATCALEFTLTGVPGVGNDVTIPGLTRVTKVGSELYWATDVDLVISDLDTTGSVAATCETAGADGNGFAAGEIDTQVAPIAEVLSVENMATTANGSDEEDDEGLRIRIRLAPTAFSTAGPKDAYEFWARTASALIADVSVVSPNPGEVDVYVLLDDGELPDGTMLTLVETTLNTDTVRPLTDTVDALAPTPVNFSVSITYYVHQDDSAQETEIDAAVAQAVTDYVAWQISAIGRDVNPSELIERVMQAGAKRVTVTTPTYAGISTTQVAALSGAATVTDGGLEAD